MSTISSEMLGMFNIARHVHDDTQMLDGPVVDVLDHLVVILEVGDRNVVREDASVNQKEVICHKLSSCYGRNVFVIDHQLLGQQVPVLCVVVDSEIAAKLQVGQNPRRNGNNNQRNYSCDSPI